MGLLLLAAAAALLTAGAELFVDNVAGTARQLGLSILGVAVLLAGAEPEELVTAVLAAVRDRPNLAAGDAVGANLTVLTLGLGLAALARPLPFAGRVRRYALLSAAAGVLGWLALADEQVSRAEGALLLGAYALLVAAVWRLERSPPRLGELAGAGDGVDRSGDEGGGRGAGAASLLALAGLGSMLVGGYLAVEGAARLVGLLGRSDTAVGLTLLALATTAELFALVAAAARHGLEEVAVAAVVGSAAYNATATLGAAAVAAPLVTSGLAGPAAAAAALPLLVLALAARGRLSRAGGAALCAGYGGYLLLVLG